MINGGALAIAWSCSVVGCLIFLSYLYIQLAVEDRFKGEGKGVPMLLSERHSVKVYWVSGDIAPNILDIGTRWR
jgi:hypothetical protein